MGKIGPNRHLERWGEVRQTLLVWCFSSGDWAPGIRSLDSPPRISKNFPTVSWSLWGEQIILTERLKIGNYLVVTPRGKKGMEWRPSSVL
eukprot:213532-Amorphochlora_amoeboformis.AAC.2